MSFCVSSYNMGQGLNRYPPSLCTVSKSNVASVLPDAMSSSVHETWSPGLTGPTPDGVPVRIRSPSCRCSRLSIAAKKGRTRTSSVIIGEMCTISLGIPKTISLVLLRFVIHSTDEPKLHQIFCICSREKSRTNRREPIKNLSQLIMASRVDWRLRAVMSTARV